MLETYSCIIPLKSAPPCSLLLGRTNIASTFPITGVFFSLIKYPFVLRELIVDKLKVLGSKVIKSGSHWW
jgi:hypothetical protein